MSGFETEREQLQEIMRGCRLYVKRLYRVQAFNLADVMQRIGNMSQRLCERRDLLLPAYKRQLSEIQYRYARALQQAEDLYPGVTRRRSVKAPLPPVSPGPSRSKLVHVTLPEEQWKMIDLYISQGWASSRADYFRRAHYFKGGDNDAT